MLTGIVIGSGGTLLILKSTFQHRRPPEIGNVEMRKEPVKDFMLRRMQRKLDLNEAQTKLIKADLELMAKTLGDFHTSVKEDLGKMMDEAERSDQKSFDRRTSRNLREGVCESPSVL